MREIPLTKGHVALVDDEDYEQLMAIGKWHVHPAHSTLTNTVYYARSGRRSLGRPLMHRVLMSCLVDHINRNGLDNRRVNLRPATPALNAMNRPKLKYADRIVSSIYKGVYRHRRDGWVMRFQALGIDTQRSFATELEAALAYNDIAQKYAGEFALLNDVGDVSCQESRAVLIG